MALKKDIDTPYGLAAQYHKVLAVYIDWGSANARIDVGSYLDQGAAQAGKQPLTQASYTYSKDAFPFAAEDNIQQKSYETLLQLPLFEGAETV